MSRMLSPRTTYFIVLSGAAFWCLGFILAPATISAFGHGNVFSEILYAFFHRVCHQMDTRSLHLFGEPLAVCSRCSAIYVSFLLGAALYPFLRRIETPVLPSRMFLFLAALPMVVDAAGGILGVHDVTMQTRLVTGAMFGSTLPFFILPIIIEGLAEPRYTPST